jgi:hypothetical protein
LADYSLEKKVLKVLARKKTVKKIPRRLNTLTDEETLLSMSRSSEVIRRDSSNALETQIGEPIHDGDENLGVIQEVGPHVDDGQPGAHGSRGFSMHVPTLFPLAVCLKRQNQPRVWHTPNRALTEKVVEVKVEARLHCH